MGLIDTHTHLESFVRNGNLVPIVERARVAGVQAMVTIGTSIDDWSLYRDLAEAHPGIIAYTVGLHPCSVEDDWEDQLRAMESFWNLESGRALPVGLGEVGLDRFHLPKDPQESARVFARQRAAFEESLRWARNRDVPIVVHSRNAFRECVQMVDASGVNWAKVVFHCFVEGVAEMKTLTDRGGWGSFTGVATYKSADKVRAALRVQGLDRLMLETDAPYLTPVPNRGKPNEPAFIAHTAAIAATTLGVTFDELARVTTATSRGVFGL